ncbi:uroporphyrinogen III methyltransferase [Lysobacter helvus]|uniref:Uroporphyrinogen-III synthase n=2 Tax=Lysobacteraceae TaxID=32033 RepID=A0ABM7Q491_9GAMM|nr:MULTISPECIES: uroporphyrinogen-III synthase [Lysobacter]BCT92105.1 uroporphyrinogen III methyltransferase [Lysobacter caseinilyticus]BCT95258.1 uroporphyrinogen III methyltransferase [Lysobacter helvus]
MAVRIDERLRRGAARHKLRAMRPNTQRGTAAWYVISLRPVGQHGALRRAAANAGAQCIAVSTTRIAPRNDKATRAALRAALAAPVVVFTSPNAVRCAAMLSPLRPRRGQVVCAIGAGTAAALRRAGLSEVVVPARADSEGVLALPALRDVAGRTVGLVTAPGGRDRLAPGLQARGAKLARADVYARVPIAPSPRAWTALRTLASRPCIAMSSVDALRGLVEHAPVDLRARVLDWDVAAGSARLADEARALGFRRVRIAAGVRPAELVAAARDGGPRRSIR